MEEFLTDAMTEEECLAENLVKTYFYDYEWANFSRVEKNRYISIFLNHDKLVDIGMFIFHYDGFVVKSRYVL